MRDIPLKDLKHLSPFKEYVWSSFRTPIRKTEIRREITKGNFLGHRAWSQRSHCSRIDHIRRIAFLVVHGWTSPIKVNIKEGYLPDGNHRPAAALFRGDSHIKSVVTRQIG